MESLLEVRRPGRRCGTQTGYRCPSAASPTKCGSETSPHPTAHVSPSPQTPRPCIGARESSRYTRPTWVPTQGAPSRYDPVQGRSQGPPPTRPRSSTLAAGSATPTFPPRPRLAGGCPRESERALRRRRRPIQRGGLRLLPGRRERWADRPSRASCGSSRTPSPRDVGWRPLRCRTFSDDEGPTGTHRHHPRCRCRSPPLRRSAGRGR